MGFDVVEGVVVRLVVSGRLGMDFVVCVLVKVFRFLIILGIRLWVLCDNFVVF